MYMYFECCGHVLSSYLTQGELTPVHTIICVFIHTQMHTCPPVMRKSKSFHPPGPTCRHGNLKETGNAHETNKHECTKVQNQEFMPLWTDLAWRHDLWQFTKLNL